MDLILQVLWLSGGALCCGASVLFIAAAAALLLGNAFGAAGGRSLGESGPLSRALPKGLPGPPPRAP